MEIKVGAIILSPGFEPFDPKLREEYGYGKYENVVTSLDYERLLAPRDPTRARYGALPTRSIRIKSPGFTAWVPGRLSPAATVIVPPSAAPIPRSR